MSARIPGRGAGGPRLVRLAVRLTAGGGREQWTRLAVTAFGVALGVGLLLLTAVAFPAIRAQEAREAWTDTATVNSRPDRDPPAADPLLWRDRWDSWSGRDIQRVDVAPTGAGSPLPPGLDRIPGPGELAVSPALRDLLGTVPADQLADRYPGRITGTVRDAALVSPDELVVFVGYEPGQLRGQPGVDEVRSIETQPRSVALTRFGRVLLGIGAAALLVPIVVLIGTATRLAAARREQRLAAMRLVGATPWQVRLIAAVEAVLGATAGTVLGFGLFALLRPAAAHVDLTGRPFFVTDLRLSWPITLLVGLGVPVLAVGSALVSLRRLQVSPLGVARRATRSRPGWRRLLPLALGLAGFLGTLPAVSNADGSWLPILMAALITVLIVGIIVAGPWLTRGVGLLLVRASRSAPNLLAGHRLVENPNTGFRSISGLVLAVFLVTLAGAAVASTSVPVADPGQVLVPAGAVEQVYAGRDGRPVPADQADALVRRLRGMPGVTGVLDLRLPDKTPGGQDAGLTTVVRCADLVATGMGRCAGAERVVGLDARLLDNGFLEGLGQPGGATDPDRLPLAGLLVTTTGQRAVTERVRTAIEAGAQGADLPSSADELKGRSNKQAAMTGRVSDAVLLVVLLIAGFSLAVSVAGGLVERKRPFALLRLAGMRPSELRRVLLAETAGPLLCTALASVLLGLAVAWYAVRVAHAPWRPPAGAYWLVLGGGLAVALGIAVAATLPMLARLTSLETARFE
ncbi:FtsX-like permease family protein [Plantactinospora siamensis]|uniref:FtsX-like permease family protein n=1 Tax=Plantactinospora siamensis TaxID=555372 RepID=A0ABV6NVM5_9ACTN